MTDYTITTNFGAKDSLPSGNAGKVIKGEEFTTEFTNIQTAVNTKADTAGDTFTGAVNFSADVAVNTNTLFVDVSEDKVGIGTTSPTEKLQVNGNIKIGDSHIIGNDAFDNLTLISSSPEGIVYGSNTDHIIKTGSTGLGATGTERMRIASSGNVGIGTASPDQKLDVAGVIQGGDVAATGGGTALSVKYITGHTLNNFGATYSSAETLIGFGVESHKSQANKFISTASNSNFTRGALTLDNELKFFNAASTTTAVGSEVTMTERMRIDSIGNLLVGRTSDDYSTQGISLRNSPPTNSSIAAFTRDGSNVASLNRLTNDGTLLTFFKDSAQIGSIGTVLASGARYFYIGNNSANSGIGFYATGIYPSNGLGAFSSGNKNLGSSTVRWLTAYLTQQPNVSSDQRLKQNIEDADDAGSTIDAIQVRKFDWIEDGRHQKYGMIAQELAEVYPEAVNVPENEEDTLGIATGDLIPMLIKEIQSLRSRVAELENV